MKNIMIVNRKGRAVAVGAGEPIIVEGTGSFVGIKAINAVLKDIPVEAGETTCFYIPDTIQGIITGAAVEYVKTGKTGTGSTLTGEEVEAFREFYKLYAERILNVRFSLAKFVKDANIVKLRTKAWEVLSSVNTTVNTTTVAPTVLDPDKDLREALGKKMLEAISSGDMDLYAVLKGERDKLKAPEVVNVNTTATIGKVEYDASKWGDDEPVATITPSSRNKAANTTVEPTPAPVNEEEIPEEAEGNIAW